MLLEIACDPNLEVPIDRDRVRAFIQVSPYISVATLFSKGTFLIGLSHLNRANFVLGSKFRRLLDIALPCIDIFYLKKKCAGKIYYAA
jgi:hypothetical protein